MIDAAPVSANQQGHHEALTEAVETTGEDAPLPAEEASIAGVYLWCASPGGHACRAASAVLGTGPKETSGLPTGLLTVEDQENDCAEPTIQTIEGRLTRAFGVQMTGWRDQTGTYLDLPSLSDMYSAAGCINDADTSLPVAKISATGGGGGPRMYLVRVWEGNGGAGGEGVVY